MVVFRDDSAFSPFKPRDANGRRRTEVGGYYFDAPEGAHMVMAATTEGWANRLAENFAASDYFDNFLKASASGSYDLVKLTYYLTYLLDRISIVEIRIERQENVAMIFEVVNDRGLGLKPYEILKGKLIGNLGARQREKASEVWTDLQERYFQVRLKNTSARIFRHDRVRA